MRRIFPLLWGLMGLVACGSEIKGGGNSGSGGSGGSDMSSSSSNSSSSSGGSSVQCFGTPTYFPTFDKSCAMAADCAIALHQTDCCGTRTAIGINNSDKPAFDAAEATCEMQYPGCGCAQGPTSTEDGKTSTNDMLIQVDCTNGQCLTFFP